MVNTARVLAVLAALVTALMISGSGLAAAQPDDTGGTYGFNDVCEDLHDALDGAGIPGAPFDLGDLTSGLCKAGNVATHPGEAVEAVKDKAWDTTFGGIVDSLVNGLGEVLIMSLTWWIKLPNETLADSPSLFATINDYTGQLQIYVLTFSIILCGTRLAIAHWQAAAEEAAETFRVLARSIFAASMFSAILVLAARVTDNFANWVIQDATNGNATGVAEAMVKASSLQAFSPGLVLILAIGGVIGGLAQIVFAVIRQGLLILAVGVLPLAAAASGHSIGRGLYDKLIGWTIAFLLWKPVAALVYMVAFTTANINAGGSDLPLDGESAQRALVGIVLLCSAGLLLPALMRLVSPTSSSSGSKSGAIGSVLAGAAMIRRGNRLAKGAKNGASAGWRTGTTVTRPGVTSPPTGAAPKTTGDRGPAGPAGTPGSKGADGTAGKAGAAGASGSAVIRGSRATSSRMGASSATPSSKAALKRRTASASASAAAAKAGGGPASAAVAGARAATKGGGRAVRRATTDLSGRDRPSGTSGGSVVPR